MKIASFYNHLNAKEYLLVNRPVQFEEIKKCLEQINANDYLKISCDKANLGKIYYDQRKINEAIKHLLNIDNWQELNIQYYVTSDEKTTQEIVNISDKNIQKKIIEERGFKSYLTNNQVDFYKDKIAVEVQFGKYFSVAYDLHVKHTFFYYRNAIDVGVEIIPTKAMEEHMDSGVSWFENEITNVIREGRANPPVPIIILGIEPEVIASREPKDYSISELIKILQHSDIEKFKNQVKMQQQNNNLNSTALERIEKIKQCLKIMEG